MPVKDRLFDMDDSLDKLSDVSERYPPVQMFALKDEQNTSRIERGHASDSISLKDELIKDLTSA